MHLYWFCYRLFLEHGWTLEIINKILSNFQRTAGLFAHTLYTKIFALVLLALSCLGQKGVKNEKITWPKIYTVSAIGFILYFMNSLLLQSGTKMAMSFYIVTLAIGYLSLLLAGTWMTRRLKTALWMMFSITKMRALNRKHS